MPVSIPSSYPARSNAQKRRLWNAVALLVWMLPEPYNYASSMGRGFRKFRLVGELMEFDFLYRLRCGEAARFDQLVCVGMLLIASCKGRIPTRALPLDEDMLVNPKSFEGWLSEVDARLNELNSE